jgi:hypothetical protein
MKRYNQGFLKFGPMEQCDTGEWVKHSDIDSYLDKYGEQHAKVFSSLATEMFQENSSIMLKLKVITSALIMSFVANAVFLSVM